MKMPTSPKKTLTPRATIPTAPAKKFTSATYETNTPERVLLYADSGMGKSSLAMLAPKPVFIALDEGVSKLRHPVTGAPADYIPGVETFQDVRAVLHQLDLFDPFETVVIDTVTKMQDLAEPYVCQTIPKENDGGRVTSLVGYGYNKGYKHLYDVMRLILADCDELIRRGKNVILIAQASPHTIANPGGLDFLRDGPRLHIDKSWSIEAMYCEWADHVLRIDYTGVFVDKDKKVGGDTERAIYVKPELYFRAKSRTIDEPIISFRDKADDNIWKFIFGEDK